MEAASFQVEAGKRRIKKRRLDRRPKGFVSRFFLFQFLSRKFQAFYVCQSSSPAVYTYKEDLSSIYGFYNVYLLAFLVSVLVTFFDHDAIPLFYIE